MGEFVLQPLIMQQFRYTTTCLKLGFGPVQPRGFGTVQIPSLRQVAVYPEGGISELLELNRITFC